MRRNLFIIAVVSLIMSACTSPPQHGSKSSLTLEQVQERAAKFNSRIALPTFETSAAQIQGSVSNAIALGNSTLDRVGAIPPASATFDNTVRAIDDLVHQVVGVANRLSVIEQTSTNAALRDAATAAIKEFESWMVGLEYREDVYRVVKGFADTQPKLAGEDAKLLTETMRDYKRAGLHLSKVERDEVEALRKQLTGLSTDYQNNITKAKKVLVFTKAELEGVPEDFLTQIKTGDDQYSVLANVTWHYISVMDNARREETRKRLLVEQSNLAREENLPLLEKILPLRHDIARRLGYAHWADYGTEVKMVKNAATAIAFEERLIAGLQPKFAAELAEYQKLKVKETGDSNARVEVWDWRYFSNQLKKERYNVDVEQLRAYFPYQRVLDGMFAIYQSIFGLKFQAIDAPYKWVDGLQLYAVLDEKTGEPMGMFYLDMFPREGKYNHFAQFGIIDGKELRDGTYQRPTVALVCNFPAPTADRPSLLSHSDVETLFHEFGHAMHSILTRAKYTRFSGTSVPRDFVEAPSQMLEYWVWDKKVLDSFAADYRDPTKKIPEEVLAKLKEARLATEGTRYRRQLSFGLMDLTLHTQITKDNAGQALALSNQKLSEVFLPMPSDTAFVTYFGHIIGYSAGYYGYAWADAISADMATVFEKAPNGYHDKEIGMRLRREIYEPGDSRDVNISIEKFLGRPRSLEPFFKHIGMQ
ncbi:MAG TPA: M3 family metallopeptidase [Verrucomicrobiae bacterium]|nr:M3 family metallopeptidase [Verrucomicrobiae bacterium]